jgi:hypothetical protein
VGLRAGLDYGRGCEGYINSRRSKETEDKVQRGIEAGTGVKIRRQEKKHDSALCLSLNCRKRE